LRSALGFGFKDVIISNNTVDLYNDKVIRATQGAHFKLNIIRSNLLEIIKDLKARNYMIIGTSLKDAINLQEIKKTKKYAVILGNEAVGVNPELLCETDKNVRIEISRELESLNVSIAGAIIMYYLSELKLEI
jgi:TrmH family RNA methyltransferase